MMQASLSVILLTWNSEKDVHPCLDSLLESTSDIQTEIIVVDNGSSDNTIKELTQYGDRINLTQLQENKGVAVARNIALKQCHNDLVWILDIDTTVNAPAIRGMMDYLLQHDECGLCACKLTDLEGNVQDSCRKLPWPKYKVMNFLSSDKFKKRLPDNLFNRIKSTNEEQFYHKELSSAEPFAVEYTIGACQMFKREILGEVGYLDEKIFYGPEDADFCQRISRQGKKVVVLPNLQIIHHYNRASQKKLFSKATQKHIEGLLHYYWKQRG